MGTTFDDVAPELLQLRIETVEALGLGDISTARQKLDMIEVHLALIPNLTRSNTAMEFSNRIQELQKRLKRKEEAAAGIRVSKMQYVPPGSSDWDY